MAQTDDQTLTSVHSPLSSGELPDVALLLMVGSAEEPALPATRRLLFVGDQLELGRRASEESRPGVHTALLSISAARTAPGSTTSASKAG